MGVGVAGRQKKMHHRAKPAVQKVAANRVPAYVDVVAGGVAGEWEKWEVRSEDLITMTCVPDYNQHP